MDILFLNHNVKWRSTFHRCLQFGKQLVARGHHVDLVTIAPDARQRFSESLIDGVRVIESPDLLFGIMRTGWDPYDTIRRIGYLRHRRYDLVHAFDCRPAVILPALAQARRDDAVLLTDWSDWWGRGGVIADRSNKLIRYGFGGIETFFEEHFRTRADGLTTISRALLQRALDLGVMPERAARICSGAPCDQILPLEKAAARDQIGLPPRAKVVLFSGFVHYDLALLSQAFEVLARERKDVYLLLLGPASPLVWQFADRGGWSDRVIQAGVVEFRALPTYLACADVFALPLADTIANRGRWPHKIGDYLSAARPIVSNPVGDTQEYYTRFDIGYLTEDTPAAFAQGLACALDDTQRAQAQGETARYVAEHELAWPQLAEALEQHYERVGALVPAMSQSAISRAH